MEQEGRGESDQNQQRRRMKLLENPQPLPQKCPRCDSNNTKFCYYNNYSLTQPRYLCKACRRYWTQGGTLRNVPVGGSCRKGRRTSIKSSTAGGSSTGESSSGSLPPPSQALNITTANLPAAFFSGSMFLLNQSRYLPKWTPLGSRSQPTMYSGGGFLSSLAAMQSIAQPCVNQFGGDTNMLHLLPTKNPVTDNQNLFQTTRPLQGSWTQMFVNNNIWNTSSGAAINSTMAAVAAASSLSANQLPDLSGFGPSP